jgi:hypothetical protein
VEQGRLRLPAQTTLFALIHAARSLSDGCFNSGRGCRNSNRSGLARCTAPCVLDILVTKTCRTRVSWPLLASAKPQACRSMCGCALDFSLAASPAAVVKGEPRSEANTNADFGSCSRCIDTQREYSVESLAHTLGSFGLRGRGLRPLGV